MASSGSALTFVSQKVFGSSADPRTHTPQSFTSETLPYSAFNASRRRRATTRNAPGPYGMRN
jgi:hypothetical protein